jgi:hypothetical protein
MKTVQPVLAKSIHCRPDALVLVLRETDEEVAIPWEQCSERLASASVEDRERCELSPGGYGVHWSALDEDLSVGGLLSRREGHG